MAVMKAVDEEHVDEVVCLGDVVGYGADPNACCQIIQEMCKLSLLGNHDAAIIGAMDPNFYYDEARNAIFWTREILTPKNFEWLYSLPYTYEEKDVGFFHSAPILPSGFFYVVQVSEAQAHTQIFERIKPLNFIGHAHLSLIYALSQKKAKPVEAKNILIKEDVKYIVNVGSVGQPRDRDPTACFGIFDTDEYSFRHVRVPYDIETAAGKIVNAGLNERFAKRLFVGV
jgi:diadenosine tetraphosphatase ApaH/serine/threonine PP2A family protein phosphatase